MITSIKNNFQVYFKSGNSRALKVKKNILYSFLIKGGSIVIGLLIIPLTINYVNPVQYGIWLTISSIVAWMNNFDIGLSHGLRNKLAHSIALNETENIANYVSTTYAILSLLSLITFLIFFISGSLINWNEFLNISHSINFNIWPVILMAIGGFCIQFALQPLNSILIATHQPFMVSLLLFLGQLFTLVIIYFAPHFLEIDLFLLVTIMSGVPIIVMSIANIYFFTSSLKAFRPRLNDVYFGSIKSLLQTGITFFIIQLGALVLYQTDNIIITKALGPKEVAVFNVAFKIFSVFTACFMIILTPFWSAFTEAYAKKDYQWIKDSIKKMKQVWLGITFFAFILAFISDDVYKIWIGDSLSVPKSLSFSLALYVSVLSWYTIHSYALNGIGKLKIQMVVIIVSALINIPLSFFLIHLIGLSGVVVANIFVFLIMGIVFHYQTNLILNNKAKGIWDN